MMVLLFGFEIMKSDSDKHYIIIGAMKCGTTSLFHSLAKHSPSINASKVKDTKFFVKQAEGGNWERGLNWYLGMFPSINGIKLEASTHYSKYPDYSGVPVRIKRLFKNVKLIYLVRDPVQRAISHFFHNRLIDKAQLDINQALSKIDSKYMNYSDYALQLSQYYHYFNPEDIIIINIVEAGYREKSLAALKHFLEIDVLSNSFALEYTNTIKENVAKAAGDKSLTLDMINASNNNIQLALKFGLQHQTLQKMIHQYAENAVKFQKFYPFTASWLDNYKPYL